MVAEPQWRWGVGWTPAVPSLGLAMARLWSLSAAAVASQTDRWFLWAPVWLAAGIGGYFALPVEPHLAVFVAAGVGITGLALLALGGRSPPLSLFLAVVLAGFVLAKLRTELVRHPTLAATTGAVELSGWVEAVAPAENGRLRLKVRIDRLDAIGPEARPTVVRLTIRRPTFDLDLGQYVVMRARLLPLPGPVEPGGYDAARALWFEAVGATGIGFGEPRVEPEKSIDMAWSPRAWIETVRTAIGRRIASVLPPETAGFATALITGERAGIAADTRRDLQVAGLAHILAISGLHMSLMAGSVFWLLRAGLALSTALALNYPIKKWAASGALVAGFGYLLVSGAGVATQRAYIMLAVMGLAVFLDRPAISLRNMALAALIILVATPEAVLTASFQMSFMAVMGLVAFYEAISDWRRERVGALWPESLAGRAMMMTALAVAAMAATTLVASIFTALPAAYHFNRVSVYSLLANLLALPVVSLVVMPAGLLAAVAMPLGLEAWPLTVMGWGIGWVAGIAHWVAGLPGAGRLVRGMPAAAAIVTAFGAMWLCLWRDWLRLAGLPVIALGLALTPLGVRPDILVERTGRNVAMRNGDGLLVPAEPRRGRYAVENWLIEDGDDAAVEEAAARSGWSCADRVCRGAVKGLNVVYLREGAEAATACQTVDIVIAEFPLRGRCRGAALAIDRFDVWRRGAHAVYVREGRTEVVRASDLRGDRPWITRPVPRSRIRALDYPQSDPMASNRSR